MYSCPNEADFFLHWCKDGAGSLLDLIISSSYVPNITSSLELPNIVRIVYMILPENMRSVMIVVYKLWCGHIWLLPLDHLLWCFSPQSIDSTEYR